MQRHLLTLLFLPSLFHAQGDKKSSAIGPADAARMVIAKQKLYAGEYVSALNLYRDIEKTNPNSATVKYYVGLCYFNNQQPAQAKEALQKAEALSANEKPEVHLVLGKIYQAEEKFDDAVSEYTQFQNSRAEDRESKEDAAVLMQQCNNAKEMMAHPLDVSVTNLGPGINSAYDDKNPCVTADGSTLVFTTRRPESSNDPTDVEGDGKYFENIYLSHADSGTHEFTKAAPVSGAINTPAHDACTSISPDGKQIFLYRNDASEKASRGGNIFVSKVSSGRWRKPEPLGKPINSTYWEGGACVDPSGKKYFFSSEREGGLGNSDIWMVERTGKDTWGKPVNLGQPVNSPYDEAGMFLAPDGKTLFFCSNGPGSMGSYDVFKTVYENGQWSKPVNVGYPVNSAAREGQLTLSADARYAYLSSNRAGGLGESDVYRIDLKDYAILEKDGKRTGNGLAIIRGTIRDSYEGYGVQDADVSLKHGDEVMNTSTNDNGEYFFTVRPGTYQLSVAKKGFQPISEAVEVQVSGKETPVIEKGYLLKKQ